jgi:hypothetical protein
MLITNNQIPITKLLVIGKLMIGDYLVIEIW